MPITIAVDKLQIIRLPYTHQPWIKKRGEVMGGQSPSYRVGQKAVMENQKSKLVSDWPTERNVNHCNFDFSEICFRQEVPGDFFFVVPGNLFWPLENLFWPSQSACASVPPGCATSIQECSVPLSSHTRSHTRASTHRRGSGMTSLRSYVEFTTLCWCVRGQQKFRKNR